MPGHSFDSVHLHDSQGYIPRAFDDHHQLSQVSSRSSSRSLRLTRNHTHVSELGRIILGIKDDRELDAEQYLSYNNNMEPEAVLAKQLSSVPAMIPKGVLNRSGNDDISSLNDPESDDNDHPQDGIFAFWQSFLVMLMAFLTWGTNAAFGVFLNFYLSTNSFPGASDYEFALMGGMVVFLAQFLAPFSTLAVRIFGQTPVHLVGICLQTLGYFLAAECTQQWQLFICQGVMIGISFSLVFIPGTLIIPTWFNKSKALGMGIAVSGAGLGGLVYSLTLNAIVQKTGDQKWALRTTGFMDLAIALFGTAFIRTRNKQKVDYKVTLRWDFIRESAKVVFNFQVFLNYPLLITGIWFGVVLFGYVIILYSLAAVATSVGLSLTQSSNVLAVLNAAQTVGRPAVGNLGDTFGRNNTAIVVCICVGILLTAFWLNATTYATNMVLAALFGCIVGIGSLMSQSLAYDVLLFRGIPEKIPAAWGGVNIIVSVFSLPAELIALKLHRISGEKSYRNTQIFTGCCFFFGALLMLVNREWLVRQRFLVRHAEAEKQLNLLSMASSDPEEPTEKECVVEDGLHAPVLEQVFQERIHRYNRFLGATPVYFALRMFYPIKV